MGNALLSGKITVGYNREAIANCYFPV